ncbi:MAG: transketolase [Candidatus Sericytochromatia bacterium]
MNLTEDKNKLDMNTRKIIIEAVRHVGASHIGTSFSCVEILNAIYRSVDINKIKNNSLDRNRVIISKGHSAAAVYSILYKYGLISKEILDTYHKNGSILCGHVSHFAPYIEHSTGALGHGLPVAVGIAVGLISKGLKQVKNFVLLGDGEMQEGSNWEAIMLAGHMKLNNLYILVDKNSLAGTEPLDNYCSLGNLKNKFESFDFLTFEVDGHNEDKIYSIIQENKNSEKPVAIICNTIKGKGVSFMENNNTWHYRPLNEDWYNKVIEDFSK